MQGFRPLLALLLMATATAAASPPAPLPTLKVAAASTRTLTPEMKASRIGELRRLHALALQQYECDTDEGSRARQHDQAYALDAQRELVFIGCQTGVYNANVMVFVVDSGRSAASRALRFNVPGVAAISDDADTFELQRLGWPRFDPISQRLTETTFYRGLGDCGHAASWRWDGAAFQPETVQLQPNCDGGESDDWPTPWRTASSPANVARQFGPVRGDDTPP